MEDALLFNTVQSVYPHDMFKRRFMMNNMLLRFFPEKSDKELVSKTYISKFVLIAMAYACRHLIHQLLYISLEGTSNYKGNKVQI